MVGLRGASGEVRTLVRSPKIFAPLLLLATALAIGPMPASARVEPGRYDRSGIDGSGKATVQPVTLPTRTGLVAAVPGSAAGDAWAIGRSTARVAGWAGEVGGSQTVFLRHTHATGWRLAGPPLTPLGAPANPTLTSISMASSGDGWAVGDRGSLVRLVNGRWVMQSSPTQAILTSVSIISSNNGNVGFASGSGGTVLRLQSNRWTREDLGIDGSDAFQLRSISTVSANDAWIAGSSGRALAILRRTSAGWVRVQTGRAVFDEEEQPRQSGSVTVASTMGAAAAATKTGAWIGGTIVPIDAGSSLGDPAGDSTRPFVLFLSPSGAITSFCPDRYSLGSDGRAATETTCDEPFPLSGFGISSLHAFPAGRSGGRGEVFAGGLGLFHYSGGSWSREPNPLSYLSSISFGTPKDGWIAGSGGTTAATGAFSTLTTVGHWTERPERVRMARHPQPVTDAFTGVSHALESLAIAPDGSGRALAVGQRGAMLLHTPGPGWDSLTPVTARALHAVAWTGDGDAWAVGGRGTLARFDGAGWSQIVDGSPVTTASLFGIAFARPDLGYAVGANGTLLRFDGRRWTVDPQSRRLTDADLFAIASAGPDMIAVGADGVMLRNRNGRWQRVSEIAALIERGGQLPALYTVAGLPDGTAVVGGELSTLIRRDGTRGAWKIEQEGLRVPPEGTVLAVAARRSAGSGLELIASVAQGALKYAGETPAQASGVVLHGTAEGWDDLDHSARTTIYDSFDASATRDPAYAIAFDAGGPGAWAVGGIGPGNDDGQGHVQGYPTSSVYRIEPNGDPAPQGSRTIPAFEDNPNLVSFAFFGESSCGQGLCGAAIGSGTMADVVASQIQREINEAAALAGGPSFVMFGGNMRRTGIPEELGQFNRYVDGFRVPFFGALGGRDLFTGLHAPGITNVNPQQVSPDHTFYQNLFRDQPRPWGDRPARSSFIPVRDDANARGARTHYAFDYAPGGKRKLRVVVLDDSAPGRLSTATTQNPARDQSAWLADVLRDAQSAGVPSIIVMNRPARNPLDLTDPESGYDEALGVQGAAANIGASAVLTSYFKQNSVLLVSVGTTGTTPVYVFGGGGSPLEAKHRTPPTPPEPSLGYYHSWQMVTVDLSVPKPQGQAEVTVRSYPVFDTLALHAIDGTSVAGGNTLRFIGSGRAPEGGGPADPLQSKAAVVPMDFRTRGVCPPQLKRKNRYICTTTGPIGPAFIFQSEDPRVGYFVVPSAFNEMLPYIDPATGLPVADAASGLFCAVGAGTTRVSISSGFHRAQMLVTVGGGRGPCVKERIVEPPQPPDPPKKPLPGTTASEPVPRKHVVLFRPPLDQQAAVVLPPPPAPVVAPAPPAAGYGRKEEAETAPEQQVSEFRALPIRTHNDDVYAAYIALVAAMTTAFAGACGAAALHRRRQERAISPARAPLDRRRR